MRLSSDPGCLITVLSKTSLEFHGFSAQAPKCHNGVSEPRVESPGHVDCLSVLMYHRISGIKLLICFTLTNGAFTGITC